jgi:hypothetical protein
MEKIAAMDEAELSRLRAKLVTDGVESITGDGYVNPSVVDDASALIYFTENTFYLRGCFSFRSWVQSLGPSFRQLLRKLRVDVYETRRLAVLAQGLKICSGLEGITIGIDEAEMVRDVATTIPGIPVVDFPTAAIDEQLNLLVLRYWGMDDLRKIRIPRVLFTSFSMGDRAPHRRWYLFRDHVSGPIPGGILQTVVAREMMGPPVAEDEGTLKRKRDSETDLSNDTSPDAVPTTSDSSVIQPFRLLDLPPELRNEICEPLLLIEGKINPSKRIPTTHCLSEPKNRKHVPRLRKGTPPFSALALLQTNKQVMSDYRDCYYNRNHFVFYHPFQLMRFFRSISTERQEIISKITLWYSDDVGMDIHAIDLAVLDL